MALLVDVKHPLGFEQLEEHLPAEEEKLEAALSELQKDGRIRYHARHEGYVLSTWTFGSTCAECGDEIPDGEHYLLTVHHQRKEGRETNTVRLHPECADRLSAI